MDASKSETKYERLRKIGIGSYGVVFKCVNRQTGQIVAIKRYSENDTDPIIRKIAMREVRMLRQLKHPNLIHLIEVFRRKRILHLVFDYCELTVLDVIEKYANNCPLNLIRKIIWQLVNGVSHCHAHNCIHRDIKPENILINQAGVVKLCDFGFARNMSANPSSRSMAIAAATGSMSAKQVKYEREAQLLGVSTNQMSQFMMTTGNNNNNNNSNVNDKSEQQQMLENNKENQRSERLALTEYVATRWYRAPELLVGDVFYDKKIDIWAIGCVTAELMRGEPIWPGKTDLDQLFMIKNSLGSLTQAQTHTLLTQGLYDQINVERLLSQATVGDPLQRKLPQRVGQSGTEFVFECLQMDPLKRPPCDELLQHPYIQSAQMSQFVRGASHTTMGQVTDSASDRHPSDQVITSSSRNSGDMSRQMHGGSSSDIRALGSSRQLTTRTNSQAILMMANQSGQQPASKRLLMAASETGSGGRDNTATTSYQSPKHGSLVPVPVRSRNHGINSSQATKAWPQGEENSTNQQQHKRKVPQAGNRSTTVAEQQQRSTKGVQSKRPAIRTRAPVDSKPASVVVSRKNSNTTMIDASPRRRLSQSNGNARRQSNGGAVVNSTSSLADGNQKGRMVGARGAATNTERKSRLDAATTDGDETANQPARRDRQRTNLGHYTHQAANPAVNRAVAVGALGGQQFGNTNSSASSSSPPTSLGTNRSSSTSFLPSVKR